jgi:hypothetical protein
LYGTTNFDNLVNDFVIGIAHQITILDSAVVKRQECSWSREIYVEVYNVMPQKIAHQIVVRLDIHKVLNHLDISKACFLIPTEHMILR